jgi:hypothetical protein
MTEFGLAPDDLANELDAFSADRITEATLRTVRQGLVSGVRIRGQGGRGCEWGGGRGWVCMSV